MDRTLSSQDASIYKYQNIEVIPFDYPSKSSSLSRSSTHSFKTCQKEGEVTNDEEVIDVNENGDDN